MTNDDVIKMVKGGLGEATVIQAIDAAEAGFDTSPDGLVRLKQGGVSDAVIGVRFDDGSTRVFMQETHPSWSAGARVKLVNGALTGL